WLTRDAAARLAIRNHLPLAECAHFGQHRTALALYDVVVARYSSPATTALGRLLLPYLFPELSAFATVEDLDSHLRNSDARYRDALPTEFLAKNPPPMYITLYFIVTRLPDSLRAVRDHFLALEPIVLTVDLLEQHLLAAETSVITVGAARGTPRTPFFEGSSPSPLAPSYAIAAAFDVLGAENVRVASASEKHRSSKGKGDKGGGGGSGGGGGGSSGGGGGGGSGGGSGGFSGGGGGNGGSSTTPTAALQDAMVTTTTPGGQRVSICTCTRTGRHLATFKRWPGSSLYTLATELPHVAASAQVAASGPVPPPSSCRLLSHQTLLWHHRLGHPSLRRLRGMHSRLLVSGLPRSLPPLLPLPALPCLPCVEGRLRATPQSSSFPLTTAPLQTLHMDRFREDFLIMRLHSDRGGEFSSDLLQDFCRGEGILQSFTLPDSPQQNGIAQPLASSLLAIDLADTALDGGGWRCVGVPGSIPFYHLFPYRSAPPPPPPLFLALGPPPVDPLPPQGPAPSRVSQVDPLLGTVPVEVAVDSGATRGAASRGAEPGGAESSGAEPVGVEPGGAESGNAESRGTASSEGRASASPRLSPWPEPLSLQLLREWFTQRTRLRSGAAGARDSATGDTRAGGAGVTAGAGGTGGDAAAGPGGARARAGGAGDTGAGGAGALGVGAGGAGARGAVSGGTGAGGTMRPRPYFIPLLQQPASPLPAPSPYAEQTGGLIERREPASRPASPVCMARRVPRPRPHPVPSTHAMALQPSCVQLRVPLSPPPASSLPTVPNPESDPRSCCQSHFMATPSVLTFDAEGRAVDFEVWVDHLQLFLQCERADGLSLFDLTSGASPAPPATADSTVRSQWATRDAAARLAVRRHLPTTERAHFSQYKSAQTLYDDVFVRYSSPATAALSRLMLPYLFPDLAAFPTVADLITHLRTSDTRYRDALPAEDQFLSVCPTTLTVDLLEERLLATETSIVAVGASHGDPRTPVFEGCSPSPLLPSVASAAAADLGGFESVGAASTPARRRRTGKGKGGKGAGGAGGGGGGGGGGSGGGGGGSGSGGGGGGVGVSSGGGGGGGGGGGSGGGGGGEGGGGSGGGGCSGRAGRGFAQRSGFGGGQRQQHQRNRATLSPLQLLELYTARQRGGGTGPCTYVLRTSDRAGEQCKGLHSTQRCFGRLTDAWHHQFPDATEIPRWGELSRAGVAIFDLDYDAILAAMYAVCDRVEGDCYLCVPLDPGIEAASSGTGEAAALGASASAAPGA
ncbi:unnamed protein product, partial [Closterium sp. NIES-54]